MSELIYYIIAAGVLTCILVAFLTYKSYAHPLLKLTSLPLVLTTTAFLVILTIQMMGAPIERYPEGKFDYIHHQIVDGGESIVIWAHTEDDGHRLYTIPYNREQAKKLEEAKKKQEGGKPQQGEFQPPENQKGKDDQDFNLVIEEKDPVWQQEDFVKE